ncbi:sodium:solute symporter [Alicyclobacillus sp. SO9]|uniref:sodium:solute symporter family protein n=1 Tax=Alicyclobacillus sp. SO9 TaxID=2665646 RepID=UPI0018E82284|nr:sodium:solute symporter family protein [Alicyclobacillus sp. SO9]QQE77580.1 sodium:solute symporter family protein [Alicyclobacillus sp. SO9]
MGEAFLVLLLTYTGVLLLLSYTSKKKANNAGQFLDGGRQFTTFQVFVLMTAMWGASMFSVEIDTGFRAGISAIWFGVSTIVASLFIATFLLGRFRRIGYLTNSNLIGQRYGQRARDVAALVIGLTFPIFAMKNVLAAASFLHIMLHWNLAVVLIATTMLVVLYVSFGGLWSLAYVQVINLVLFSAGLAVAAYYVLQNHQLVDTTVTSSPGFFSLHGVGLSTIIVWFGMSLLNSVSAQAEFQTISAAKDIRTGRRGVYLSSIVLVGFAVIPALLGMAAREHLGSRASGLLAFPSYLKTVAPHWALLFIGLGFWSAALIWCAPLMFSGASSFGLDLFNRQHVSHNSGTVRRFTRWAMMVQGVMIVVYALARPGDLAWWAVFGLTLRNAAVVGPTISFLLWPIVRERTILMSMIAGVVSGFGWNAVTGFSAVTFPLGINPMWVGTGCAMLVIVAGTLLENRGRIGLTVNETRRKLGAALLFGALISFFSSFEVERTGLSSLLGAALFTGVLLLFFATIVVTEGRETLDGKLSNPGEKLPKSPSFVNE